MTGCVIIVVVAVRRRMKRRGHVLLSQALDALACEF